MEPLFGRKRWNKSRGAIYTAMDISLQSLEHQIDMDHNYASHFIHTGFIECPTTGSGFLDG
jgi:hypothetical protein